MNEYENYDSAKKVFDYINYLNSKYPNNESKQINLGRFAKSIYTREQQVLFITSTGNFTIDISIFRDILNGFHINLYLKDKPINFKKHEVSYRNAKDLYELVKDAINESSTKFSNIDKPKLGDFIDVIPSFKEDEKIQETKANFICTEGEISLEYSALILICNKIELQHDEYEEIIKTFKPKIKENKNE